MEEKAIAVSTVVVYAQPATNHIASMEYSTLLMMNLHAVRLQSIAEDVTAHLARNSALTVYSTDQKLLSTVVALTVSTAITLCCAVMVCKTALKQVSIALMQLLQVRKDYLLAQAALVSVKTLSKMVKKPTRTAVVPTVTLVVVRTLDS